MALGGSAQKTNGCVADWQCYDENPCNGQRKCNATSNTCYSVVETVPSCVDAFKCTIDTCNPSKTIINSPQDLCEYTPIACEDGNKCNGISECDEDSGTCVQTSPPVNCDDGNACTVDTCDTTTGLCSNPTPRVCNDNNICTLNDSCNPAVGCVFQSPEPFCCGNAVCEAADENKTTCPSDCSGSIETSWTTTKAELGNLFNIATKTKSISIVGVDLNCILPQDKTGIVHVYSKAGDYYNGGAWYSKSKWTEVIVTETTCAGGGLPTKVLFPSVSE